MTDVKTSSRRPPRRRQRAGASSERAKQRKNVSIRTLIDAGIVRANSTCTFTYTNHEFEAVIDADGNIVDKILYEFFDSKPPSARRVDDTQGAAAYDTPSRWTTDCLHMALDQDDERLGRPPSTSFSHNRTVIPAFDKIHTTCIVTDDGSSQILSLNNARDYYLQLNETSSSTLSTSSDQAPAPKRARTNVADIAGRNGGALIVRTLSAPARAPAGTSSAVSSTIAMHQRHINALKLQYESRLNEYERTLRSYEDIIEDLLRTVEPTSSAHERATRLLHASMMAKVDVIVGSETRPSSASSSTSTSLSSSSSSSSSSSTTRVDVRSELSTTLSKYTQLE